MQNLILHIVTLVVWIVYLYPPITYATSTATLFVRSILIGILSFCIGASLGVAMAEVISP